VYWIVGDLLLGRLLKEPGKLGFYLTAREPICFSSSSLDATRRERSS